MNVLSIGSDRSLFKPGSESAARQIAYGTRFEKLNIIVFARAAQNLSPRTLSTSVHAYPTASRSRLFYVWDAFRIARQLERPDVVTVQDPFEAGIAGLIIASRLRVPLHVQVHTDFLAPAFARHSLLNRVRVFVARFVLRRAARIRVVSERIKKGIENEYVLHAPVTVLPIFIDIGRFRDADAGGLSEKFAAYHTKVLVVSRLEKEKNIALAIRSFNEVAPKDACLIIVGDGSQKEYLHTLASERVFFEGQQDSAPYYCVADLVLVTSAYEGYGRTIIEALAAGKPVLSCDVGIAREVGAIIAGDDFASSLRAWFEEGARVGKLTEYPYASFEAYADAWCADIACVSPKE